MSSSSSAAGMPTSHRDPQVKGAKVKIALTAKAGTPRKRMVSRPIEQLDGETLQKQSTIYLKERNAAMRLKRMREGMNLALARDQPGALHPAALFPHDRDAGAPARAPSAGCWEGQGPRSGDLELARAVAQAAQEVVHETLETLAKLPLSVEPGWLERLEEED